MTLLNLKRLAPIFLGLTLALSACSSEAEPNGEAAHEEAGHEEGETESGEGTSITVEAARAAGIVVERAGPGALQETIDLTGRVNLQASARAEIRAPYPGPVRAVLHNIGDTVRRGEVLARVESAESLQTYALTSPIAGVVLERATNVGDVTGSEPLFIVGDPTRLQAEFHVFPRDAERVRAGQTVLLRSLSGGEPIVSRIEAFLPAAEADSQTLIARAPFTTASGALRPGMSVRGSVVLSEQQAPLVVRAGALQRDGDGTVVFVQQGERYTPRAVQIGRRSREMVEILSGLRAGEAYVAANSFVIRADIEKSGASHGH
ncbi:MAG: efflux RND transporter periplasmic adaptor subunit [Hyphomonadaceae bacterium]